jgi:hypothetical protein
MKAPAFLPNIGLSILLLVASSAARGPQNRATDLALPGERHSARVLSGLTLKRLSAAGNCDDLPAGEEILPAIQLQLQQQANATCQEVSSCVYCCLDGSPAYVTLVARPDPRICPEMRWTAPVRPDRNGCLPGLFSSNSKSSNQ